MLSVSLPGIACINSVGTNYRGQTIHPLSHTGQDLVRYLTKAEDNKALVEWTNHVVASVRKEPSFANLIDLSAVLVRHGRFTEAVKLLQFVERKYPGRYETASNIGTAYELIGRNEDALKWIVEGVQRNPDSHVGTEWLHVLILKAKLGQLAAPPKGQSFVKLDFGNDAMPRRPARLPTGNRGEQLSLYALATALRYQSVERAQFVAAPDPIVAGMLLDWANLELLAGSVESADVLYDAALRYGSKENKVIAARKALVAQILKQAKKNPVFRDGQCELCEPPQT